MSHEWLLDIYLKHRQGLFSLAVTITRCTSSAEDAVQIAFAKLVDQTRPTGDPVAYVFQVVRNAARDLQRKQRTEQRVTASLFQSVSVEENGSPSHSLEEQEEKRQLQAAIDTLSEAEREAVVIKAFTGLTFQQAEEVLGIPAKTIATRYRRALQHLEEKLRDQL